MGLADPMGLSVGELRLVYYARHRNLEDDGRHDDDGAVRVCG